LERCLIGTALAALVATISGCAAQMVDARLHTQSGVTVSCRIPKKHPGPNLIQLDVLVTPRCTTAEISAEVFEGDRTISPARRFPKVIFENESKDVEAGPFELPARGTWLTVEITAFCDHAGKTKTGRDTCEVGD
jgi:hypothetical protein